MSIENEIISNFLAGYDSSNNSNGGFSGITLGVVVDTDDPLQMGRLRIFCPSLNDDAKKVQYVPWAIYASPFAGSINNKTYTRGVGGDQKAESEGAIAYGFWAIPELGAHVLVGCVDGDFRRRFWIACAPQHQETSTMHNGRWKWEDGEIEGPLTSDDKPLQPLYDNMKEAYQDKKKSPEWKTRAADYQSTANRKDALQTPNTKKKKYTDQTNADMVKNEDDEWVKDAIGAHGYDWTGFKNYGAFLASRTVGISSPGLHSVVLDDRPFNSRIRIRTTTGHQILLDDTNERIYIATNKGKSWVEMDTVGNIDVFSEARVSITAADDINFTAGKTIRLFAEEGIHMFAGHGVTDKRTPLESPPFKGEIRIQSDNDLHIMGQNVRMKSLRSMFQETGIDFYTKVGQSSFMDAQKDINVRTITGNHVTSTGGSMFTTSAADIKIFSQGKGSFSSFNDMEMHSFTGTTSISAAVSTQIKAMNGDVGIEAGAVSGSGNISQTTPNSQHTVGDSGVSVLTTGKISSESSLHETIVSADGHTPPTPAGMAGPMLFSAGETTKILVGVSDITLHSPSGTIINKTALNSQTYDVLSDKVDETAVNLDILTKQVSEISTAVDIAVSGFSPPVSFDIACLDSSMFGSIPSSFLDLFPDLGALNAALALLSEPPTTLEGLAGLLNGNTSLLTLLGLPSGLTLPSFGSSCTSIMDEFSGAITIEGADELVPVQLRDLIHKIFTNSGDYGPAQPISEITPPSTPPTPAPPVEGII